MTNAIATVAQETDPRQLALLKAVGLDRLSSEQRELALNIASRYELDLLMKHLVMIEGRPYITRDGLLHIAHRSGQLDGIETSEPAIAEGFWRATCSVYRKDMGRPFTYSGRYPTSGGNAKFAPEMAVKVAEVMALRRAFDVAAPTAEERWDVELPAASVEKPPTLAERAATKAAEIAPAESATSVLTLTQAELVEKLKTAGVSIEVAVATTKRLFPGRDEAYRLTGEQRAQLWEELSAEPVPAA